MQAVAQKTASRAWLAFSKKTYLEGQTCPALFERENGSFEGKPTRPLAWRFRDGLIVYKEFTTPLKSKRTMPILLKSFTI
ncbi:hypothetical protein Len3610_01440 [Lentibacillus sp. CBA3610]|nr:hypothetical protein Len3610_01440 [Lentibacillus sp. CBA3610]